MYGVGEEPTDSYARRCLMARRLVERGVRFVQLYINGQIWDNHNQIESNLKSACARTDKPVAALLKDLKQRGLFSTTLVIWGGEFGRMPIAQFDKTAKDAGRDHNPRGFSLWMAGAGIKPGIVYGATDDLGYEAVDHPVSVTDWHATILHLLGLNYQELVFDQNGLKEKLTSVFEARVVRDILA
jgi:arylsulfatase A-like enzyme